jgi:hypothetical protein
MPIQHFNSTLITILKNVNELFNHHKWRFQSNMLTQTFQSITLQNFMKQRHLKFIFFEPTIIYDIY